MNLRARMSRLLGGKYKNLTELAQAKGIVIEEVQKGYKFHDRVIRPSRVVVGNGEEEEEAEPVQNNA